MPAATMTITMNPAADHTLATRGRVVESAPYCRMGQDYDCGCRYCSAAAAARYAAEIAEWNAATVEHRAYVATITGALACLAAIGRAVATALSPGLGLGVMVHDLAALLASDIGDLKGAHYQITGKRGNAKAHTGKVGICRWVGAGDSFEPMPRFRGGWRASTKAPTTRIGLAIEGEPKLVYVSFGSVTRLRTPAAEFAARVEAAVVRAAIAPVRAKLAVRMTPRGKVSKGQVAHVVEGRDAGKSGEVFWCGADKRTGEVATRLGVKTAVGETLWVSAYDCAAAPAVLVPREERELIERIAADAAEEGRLDDARTILASRRVSVPA